VNVPSSAPQLFGLTYRGGDLRPAPGFFLCPNRSMRDYQLPHNRALYDRVLVVILRGQRVARN
jgi:hypothetical protein